MTSYAMMYAVRCTRSSLVSPTMPGRPRFGNATSELPEFSIASRTRFAAYWLSFPRAWCRRPSAGGCPSRCWNGSPRIVMAAVSETPRVAGAADDDERPRRITMGEGRDVTAARHGGRAEVGAARAFPVGVGSLASLRPRAQPRETHGQRRPRAERARAMGTSALSNPGVAAGRSRRRR